MIVLYILGALLLLLVSLTFIRVGVYVSFGQELRVIIKAGPFKRQIVPKHDKPDKSKQPKRPRKDKKGDDSTSSKKKRTFTFDEIRSAFPALFESLKKGLRKTRRRLKIHPLTVSVTFGDDDPAKVAEMYGWGCTAMWTVLPQLEQLIHMPDPRVHLDVDYNALKTRAEGEIGLSLLIRDGIGIAWSFGIPLLKWYLSTRKTRKAQEKTAPPETNTEDENKGE